MIRVVCSNLATQPNLVLVDRLPSWAREIAIDLSDVERPEWCEVCADQDEARVPPRATTTAGGARVCADCAASWEEMTAAPCSYWVRQEVRHIDDNGFGFSPWDLMTPAQAERHQAARDAEDEKDPPCGICAACVADDDFMPAWDGAVRS